MDVVLFLILVGILKLEFFFNNAYSCGRGMIRITPENPQEFTQQLNNMLASMRTVVVTTEVVGPQVVIATPQPVVYAQQPYPQQYPQQYPPQVYPQQYPPQTYQQQPYPQQGFTQQQQQPYPQQQQQPYQPPPYQQ